MGNILNIKRGWRGEDSSASSDEDGKNRQRSARHVWSIVVNDPASANATEVRQEVEANYGFSVGSAHPDDSQLIARSIRVSRTSPLMFLLEGGYVAKGTEAGASPLDEPPEVEQTFASSQALLDMDIDGHPITTVNGEAFQGGDLADEINEMVITVSRNLADWDYLLANSYMGSGRTPAATNSDPFMGFPPGACRLKGLSAKSVNVDSFLYFRATATVQFRAAAPGSTVAKAWWLRVRHEGFRHRLNAADAPVFWIPAYNLVTKDLETNPVMLKLDGTREFDNTVGWWREFKTSPSMSYAALQFFS